MQPIKPRMPRARTEGLTTQELGDELLVYDLPRHRCHNLNRTAALVWRQCDGQGSIAETAALLRDELGASADEQTVQLALDRLAEAHLLDGEAPGIAGSCSRREMMRRLTLAGGATALLPLVMTVVAPTPAAAASVARPHTDKPGGISCKVP